MEYRKNAPDEQICKAEIDTEIVENKHMDATGEGGENREIKIDTHTTHKIDNQ